MPRKVHTNIPSDHATTVVPKYLTKQEFGRRLYSLMIGKGWHQSELSRQSGIPRDSISTYVRGRSLPTPQNLSALAETFGLQPEELLPNYNEAARADEDHPSFEMKVSSGSTGTAWIRVNRLVTMNTAISIATLLENDNVPDGSGNSGSASVQPIQSKAASS